MATAPQAFYSLWQDDNIRERLFQHLPKEDICSVRVANSACCNLVTKRLFLRINLTFTANTFTKPSRIQALSRIGHHIEHLSFNFSHSDATFLPPLIHPQTGQEISFSYTPHTSMASVLARPKYGNTELGDILTQQYPPLFHAATNVPSFINALKHLPSLRHLTIKTPGQNPKERYRRDIVDYALLSLRISLERAPLTKLCKLSLAGVHPSAFNYLRPVSALGASPSSTRRWKQIRKLNISVEAWNFYGPSPGLDHLKIIDDYIRIFAPQLDKFAFTWLGRKGPCPLALSADPLFSPPRSTKKLFNEVTSPMSPLPPRPSRRSLLLPRVRVLQVRNATMNEPQVRSLVAAHKPSVREFDFDNVALVGGGSWEDALEPLTNGGVNDTWSRHSISVASEGGSALRPAPPGRSRSDSGYGSAVAGSLTDEQLPCASAAAAAASKELFDVDLEGMIFGGVNDVDALQADVQEWARGVEVAAAQDEPSADLTAETAKAVGETKDSQESTASPDEDDGGLASDIEAARQASLAFDTRLKQQRIRKKRSHRHHRRDGAESEMCGAETAEERRSEHKRNHSRSRHKHSRSDETHDRSRSRHNASRGSDDSKHDRDRSHSRHRSRSRHGHRRHHRRRHSAEPALPDMPDFIAEVLPSDDESAIRPSPPSRRPSTPRPDANISAPMLHAAPVPVMLQPTIYDPSRRFPAADSQATLLGPMAPLAKTPSKGSLGSSPAATATEADDGLSAVQRSIEAELLLAEAEEAAARSSALKRAKEAVLAKLSREFCKRKAAAAPGGGSKDSAAVLGLASFSTLDLGTGVNYAGRSYGADSGSAGGSRFGSGFGLREALFGRSADADQRRACDQLYMHPNLSGRRGLESQSALVPLIFSRS